jgi:hypothetical protein
MKIRIQYISEVNAAQRLFVASGYGQAAVVTRGPVGLQEFQLTLEHDQLCSKAEMIAFLRENGIEAK